MGFEEVIDRYLLRDSAKDWGLVKSNKEWETLKKQGAIKVFKNEYGYVLRIGKRKALLFATKYTKEVREMADDPTFPMVELNMGTTLLHPHQKSIQSR